MEIPFEKLKIATYNEKDKETINNWQDRAIEITEDLDFIKHPTTVRLVEIVKEQIEIIENRLKNEEYIENDERRALFKEKKVHQFYLNLFTKDNSEELKVIANMVKDEITN